MTAQFPHHYEASLRWTRHSEATLSAATLPDILGGPPPQFEGPPGVWSPEQLLLSAANLCLMATFMALARKARVTVTAYRSDALGVLDKTPEGLAFTEISLAVELKAPPGELERARGLLETAKKHCIVSNSLKRPIELKIAAAAG